MADARLLLDESWLSLALSGVSDQQQRRRDLCVVLVTRPRKGESLADAARLASERGWRVVRGEPDGDALALEFETPGAAEAACAWLDESQRDWRSGRAACLKVRKGRAQHQHEHQQHKGKDADSVRFGLFAESGGADAKAEAEAGVVSGDWVWFLNGGKARRVPREASGVLVSWSPATRRGVVSLVGVERGFPDKLRFEDSALAEEDACVGASVSLVLEPDDTTMAPRVARVKLLARPMPASAQAARARQAKGSSAPGGLNAWTTAVGPGEDGFSQERWRGRRGV